jgi:hypothetical protein
MPLEGFRESDAIWVFRLCCCGIGGRGHRFLVSGFWLLLGLEWLAP